MKNRGDVRSTLLIIRSHLQALTKAEQKIAEHILKQPEEIIYLSVTELAEQADVGETTVLRLCRKLGFKGFQDFKLSLAQDLVQTTSHMYDEVTEEDDTLTLIQKTASVHSRMIEETRELIQAEQIDQAVDMLTKAKRIHFYGMGSSGIAAMQATQTFSRIGLSTDSKQDPHFQAMAASLLYAGDVAVGLSVSGSTKDTVKSLEIAKEAGAKIIGITHNARSPITRVSDVVLLMASRENPLQGSSLVAQISQLFIIDLLYLSVGLHIKDKALKYRELTAKAVAEKLY